MAGRPKSGHTNRAQFKAAQLRQSILQAAVQGKLVPQNLHEEPASVLLERIRAEKALLIKEGKIKKEKPLPPITEDEIPYDLPEGWGWCRLGEIVEQNIGGGTPSKGNAAYWNGNIHWASVKDLSGKILATTRDCITELGLKKSASSLIPSGSIIVCTRMGLGKISINKIPVAINQDLRALFLTSLVSKNYFINYYEGLTITGSGMTVKGITLPELHNLLFPLPPLAEQQRIVAKVDELMALCDELEAAEKELDKLEANFAEYLPKSILQAAVQGKLVPQNIHDEPASALLERIRAEKARLVKEGKVKKEKPLPSITEEEIPYDLPEGWGWCRFGELFSLISGRDLETKQFNDKAEGVPYITGASAISNGQLIVTRWTKKSSVTSILGDLLISCKGTIGKLALNTIGDCHIARQIMALRGYSKNIVHAYIKIFLHHHVQTLLIQAKSIIPGISRDDILLSLFPLPPLVEQQRIIAKVDELMALCEQLKATPDLPVVPPLTLTPATLQQVPYEEPELLMAARGRVSRQDSEELRQAQEDLFGE